MDLSQVTTAELLRELKNRKENVINNAILNINNYIKVINEFGVQIEHDHKDMILLPKFRVGKLDNGEIDKVYYSDKEY